MANLLFFARIVIGAPAFGESFQFRIFTHRQGHDQPHIEIAGSFLAGAGNAFTLEVPRCAATAFKTSYNQ